MSEERRQEERQRKIAMSVTTTADGDYELIEHDLLSGHEREDRLVARFFKEIRVVTVKGEYGPQLAQQDMAMFRARVFADFFTELVNSGRISFG